uniref:Uncharacterized protein n=1 Tax=Anguilla anguilla TaxID=7936 RepID=A0A0E9SPA1_ANGAN
MKISSSFVLCLSKACPAEAVAVMK